MDVDRKIELFIISLPEPRARLRVGDSPSAGCDGTQLTNRHVLIESRHHARLASVFTRDSTEGRDLLSNVREVQQAGRPTQPALMALPVYGSFSQLQAKWLGTAPID